MKCKIVLYLDCSRLSDRMYVYCYYGFLWILKLVSKLIFYGYLKLIFIIGRIMVGKEIECIFIGLD